jgi:hypothetical protein
VRLAFRRQAARLPPSSMHERETRLPDGCVAQAGGPSARSAWPPLTGLKSRVWCVFGWILGVTAVGTIADARVSRV